jgi:hypothetical protein
MVLVSSNKAQEACSKNKQGKRSAPPTWTTQRGERYLGQGLAIKSNGGAANVVRMILGDHCSPAGMPGPSPAGLCAPPLLVVEIGRGGPLLRSCQGICSPPSSTAMDLSELNLNPGRGVQAAILSHFGEHANFSPRHGSKEFVLLVSVGRCKFWLSESLVDLILQATMDGSAADFRPIQIADHVFKFIVASRNVGFHVYNLRSFSCDQYKIFFNLWGGDGANWQAEFHRYVQEEHDRWTPVGW